LHAFDRLLVYKRFIYEEFQRISQALCKESVATLLSVISHGKKRFKQEPFQLLNKKYDANCFGDGSKHHGNWKCRGSCTPLCHQLSRSNAHVGINMSVGRNSQETRKTICLQRCVVPSRNLYFALPGQMNGIFRGSSPRTSDAAPEMRLTETSS
jgi:hypothetical protein